VRHLDGTRLGEKRVRAEVSRDRRGSGGDMRRDTDDENKQGCAGDGDEWVFDNVQINLNK